MLIKRIQSSKNESVKLKTLAEVLLGCYQVYGRSIIPYFLSRELLVSGQIDNLGLFVRYFQFMEKMGMVSVIGNSGQSRGQMEGQIV